MVPIGAKVRATAPAWSGSSLVVTTSDASSGALGTVGTAGAPDEPLDPDDHVGPCTPSLHRRPRQLVARCRPARAGGDHRLDTLPHHQGRALREAEASQGHRLRRRPDPSSASPTNPPIEAPRRRLGVEVRPGPSVGRASGGASVRGASPGLGQGARHTVGRRRRVAARRQVPADQDADAEAHQEQRGSDRQRGARPPAASPVAVALGPDPGPQRREVGGGGRGASVVGGLPAPVVERHRSTSSGSSTSSSRASAARPRCRCTFAVDSAHPRASAMSATGASSR